MEIIASQPGLKYINEPLLMTQFEGGGPLPAAWEFLLPHPEREAQLEIYFRKLLQNKLGIGAPAPFSRFHRIITRRIVVKELRCHDLMNWFEQRLNVQIVYLLRHPIPTSLSRKRYARLPLFLSNQIYCERYLTPELTEYCRSIVTNGTELQKKVLDWCLQNLPPLKFLDRTKWLCLHYEDLVLQPSLVVERLAEFLGNVDRRRMLKRVPVSSGSTVLSDVGTQNFLVSNSKQNGRGYLVTKWREKISPNEEDQLFEILERFDIDVYQSRHDGPVYRIQ
jgi:hypothetical protein